MFEVPNASKMFADFGSLRSKAHAFRSADVLLRLYDIVFTKKIKFRERGWKLYIKFDLP